MEEEKIPDAEIEKILNGMDPAIANALREIKASIQEPSMQKRIEESLEQEKVRKIDELYSYSGMSQTDIALKTFETFEVTELNRDAHFLVKGYLDGYPATKDQGRGFIVMGGVGVGKTHLCLAFLIELIRRYDVWCKYANVKTTLDLQKESFDRYGAGPLEELRQTPFLFLDDLGSERSTEWTVDAISTLVTYRYVEYLPTIFTTNCLGFGALLKSLSGTWGELPAERIVDRIMERNEAVVIKGKTRRKPLVRILRGKFR